MPFKPFRPPLLRKAGNEQAGSIGPSSSPSPAFNTASSGRDPGLPPLKKRRLSPDFDGAKTIQPHGTISLTQSDASSTRASAAYTYPASTNTPAVPASKRPANGPTLYFNVLWRKYTTKKHKTWDGDGVVWVCNGYAHLQDLSGRDMGKAACDSEPALGDMLSLGSKEVEIESILSKQDYLAGKPFLGDSKQQLELAAAAAEGALPQMKKTFQMPARYGLPKEASEAGAGKASDANSVMKKPASALVPSTKAAQSQFKNPLLDKSVLERGSGEKPIPRHDPNAPGALVMKSPGAAPKGKQLVDVVLDPVLSKHLRQHQREGVQFMYECVMGMRPHSGEGAILADEMGLGKTLQVIALLWTLLKQNPVYNEPPLIRKALIVCPVSLIKNWRKEFRKWLGNERIGVFIMDDKRSRLTDFTMGRSYSVMIIGYEKLRTVHEDLQKGLGVDIVIADEGHRLKTAQNKSAQAIKSLNTEKRIILSGTPLQNDLSEFYFMVDFVNPGLLGKQGMFKRQFETPILKSRQPGACEKDIEKGDARAEELASVTSQFILRRTIDILARYLPPKTEYVVFCRPTASQAAVYRTVLQSTLFSSILGSSEASLQLIDILKKLCNSPSLLRKKDTQPETSAGATSNGGIVSSLLSEISPTLLRSPAASGKLQVLDSLLHTIRQTTLEKVVIVSHYTSTLDIIGTLLDSLGYSWLRLDGSTPSSKRQEVVDRFNRAEASKCFAFLLSAKSGGVGLNLTGASRLILYDVDWNPSADLQAMARIHRDGQKRPCKIYRLLTQGTLDEKIYQRQVTKLSLADSVIDNKESAAGFTRDELRDLFRLDPASECSTHRLSPCRCGGRGTDCTGASTLSAIETIDAETGLPTLKSSSEEESLASTFEDTKLAKKTKSEEVKANGYPKPIKASELDMNKLKQLTDTHAHRADKAKLMALLQYRHVDTSLLIPPPVVDPGTAEVEGLTESEREDLEAVIDDEVLLEVIKEREESRIAYVFVKNFGAAPL